MNLGVSWKPARKVKANPTVPFTCCERGHTKQEVRCYTVGLESQAELSHAVYCCSLVHSVYEILPFYILPMLSVLFQFLGCSYCLK